MKRFLIIFIIWAAVIFAYIILTAAMPAINEIVETTNSTLTATSNMSNYPGTQEAILYAPMWIWFIPGLVGVVSSVIIFKMP